MKNLLLLSTILLLVSCASNTNNSDDMNELSLQSEFIERGEDAQVQKVYEIGDKVADFELLSTDENMVSINDYNDQKGLVIIFTCNHCPYSVAYEDRINALNVKFTDMGYPIVAINPNDPKIQPGDSFENMKIRAKEKAFTFPYLFDAKQEVFKKFGAAKTPHVFVLNNSNNEFELVYVGAIDDHEDPDKVKDKFLESAIEALAAGKQPNPSYTKAFGCSIKVAK